MQRFLALLFTLVTASAFGAAGDLKLTQRNPTDTGFIERTVAAQANALIAFSAGGLPTTIAPSALPVSAAMQTALDAKAAATHSHSAADITSGLLAADRLATGSALQVLRRNSANTALEFATISAGGGDMTRATYDANADNVVDSAAAVAWSGVTGKPTTLSGYGITDAAANGSVTGSGLTMATARLLGRSTAGTGAPEEITVGSGLTLSGGTLSASGGSSTIGVPLDFGTNPGEVVVFNSSVTTQTVGTPHSYRFQIDGNDILKVYAENDGAGGLQNRRVEVNGAPLLTAASAYGAGTAYTLTTTAAAVTLGTTSPAITLPYAGTWRVTYGVQLNYSGATITTQSAAIKLRRTNNTAADLANSSLTLVLPPATTATYTAENATKTVIYTTSLANDAVTIFANLDVAAGAGSVTAAAGGTWILAERLY